MAPLILEGDTLGKKHKHYNRLLNDAVTGNVHLEAPNPEDDITNLLMIDIASQKKDVPFLLNALKSSDMLYVSRAIKKSTWLITDKSYKHIINPNYLHAELFPHMITKAIKKLLLNIRIHLNDEERAEEFYQHEKDENIANKWLCNCSSKFIEENIKKDHYYDNHTLKRLCEKSINILEKVNRYNSDILKETMFFLNNETEKYLNIVEKVWYYDRPTFNAKMTKLLMKKCPDRIINNFEKYANNVHIPTFIKHVKSENIENFILKQIQQTEENNHLDSLLRSEKVFHLFERIPPSERYEFIKNLFLKDESEQTETDPKIQTFRTFFGKSIKKYVWFKYAPFDVAFDALKKNIQVEPSENEKSAMLDTLISCTKQNMSNIQVLLQYYNDKHIKDSISSKRQFIDELNDYTEIHKYDINTWNVLDEIFKSMNIYKKSSENEFEKSVEIIIVYKILHDEKIPEVILDKFTFQTLNTFKQKINEDGERKLFTFLYNYVLKKLENPVATLDDFVDLLHNLENALNLLKDWEKDLSDFPYIVSKIKEIVSTKKEKSWTTNLAELYNIHKSWRKLMFEESILMDPSEAACVNALKHEPSLLTRYCKEVQTLQNDNNISLKVALHKIRTYWPESLAITWSNDYLDRLKISKNHKALTRGMCYLLPHRTLIDIISSFAPKETKIDYSCVDEFTLSLQTHFAKNMHLARPQPSPDVILSYAKGDYIKFALPSLLAIFYNLDAKNSREYLPKLLDTPVSLQKHIIRLAFADLEPDELGDLFSKLWQTSKNKTIRCMIFELTFQLLCASKDPTKATILWEKFGVFIDNLSFEEDKKVYDILPKIEEVPDNIKPHFLVKSYEFLKRLIPNVVNDQKSYEWHIEKLEEYTRNIMEQMNCEFVENLIAKYLEKMFETSEGKTGNRSSYHMITVISAYLLCSKDFKTQKTKQEKVLDPLIKRSLELWNEFQDNSYFIRDSFQKLLTQLTMDLNSIVTSKKMVTPTRMFTDIFTELNKLPVSENYIMITKWKLTLSLAKLLEKTTEEEWDSKCVEISQAFAENCLEYLKQDVNTHFQCIYVLFSKALQGIIDDSRADNWKWLVYEKMLSDKDFTQAFLAVNHILPTFESYYDKELTRKVTNITELIKIHPSVEVKMHYYYKFGEGNRCNKRNCIPWKY